MHGCITVVAYQDLVTHIFLSARSGAWIGIGVTHPQTDITGYLFIYVVDLLIYRIFIPILLSCLNDSHLILQLISFPLYQFLDNFGLP